LNYQLFLHGVVGFFKTDVPVISKNRLTAGVDGEYHVAKIVRQDVQNIYGEAKKVRAVFGNGGDGGAYTVGEDIVLIYHSLARDIPQIRLWEYANKIYYAEKTIDLNIEGQKTPWLIPTTQKVFASVQRIFKKIARFEEVVFTAKGIDLDSIRPIDITTPYVADKIFDLRKHWYNEALSYIGIESNMAEKSERLLSGELFVSNGKSIARRNSMLKPRKTSAKEINNLFDDLFVEVVATNPSIMDIMGGEKIALDNQEGENIGGDPVEQVYNRVSARD